MFISMSDTIFPVSRGYVTLVVYRALSAFNYHLLLQILILCEIQPAIALHTMISANNPIKKLINCPTAVIICILHSLKLITPSN